MKKSTGILLLLTFFVIILIFVGIFVTLIVYLFQGTTPNLFHAKRLALVKVEGLIYDAQDWINQIEEYQEDDTIKGIVLRVDSPGGAVGPSQELYHTIIRARDKYGKVIVASFGDLAASGGYYIACGADRIVSSPGCLTGSIGVYAKFLQAKDLMEKIGINYETVKAGKYKDFGSIDRPLTDEERKMMQGVIDDTYSQFVEAVANGRKKSLTDLLLHWNPKDNPPVYPFAPEVVDQIVSFQKKYKNKIEASSASVKHASASIRSVSGNVEEEDDDINVQTAKIEPAIPDQETLIALTKAIADGKVYTGRQAKEIALVDQLGTQKDAIDLAAKLVGIEGKPTVIEKKKRELGWLDLISQGASLFTKERVFSPIQYRFPY